MITMYNNTDNKEDNENKGVYNNEGTSEESDDELIIPL